MEDVSPRITFNADYMMDLAMKEARKLKRFKGVNLCSGLEVDSHNMPTGGIFVEEFKEESNQ